ncbi:diguanylate cyclase [Pseudanabaena sp. PCC 6802]|uniref:diguanylate cyclase n=1 Tax=Pseudanabaena sp. PCC 6802 TaxID=118173 RepID=UPI00034B8C29|nr:diguanylate cyclase [Pseudanabaena sp. PCC 6802]
MGTETSIDNYDNDRAASTSWLCEQVERLQRANRDLQIALETTALHGDVIEAQLQEVNQQLQAEILQRQQKEAILQSILEIVSRQKADLEVILQTTVEHSDTIEAQLYVLNQQLQHEVGERKQSETALQSLLKILSKEKDDLEAIMRTIIEHGDAVETHWFNKALEANLLATVDGLTQIANRRKFDEYCNRQWQQMLGDRTPLALVMCDVDFFKDYNDAFGHLAGDDCLRQVALSIDRVLNRPMDMVARFGGEEFVVVLPQTSAAGAMKVAELIQTEIANARIIHPRSLVSDYVTLSIGIVSVVPTENRSPKDLIDEADQALYIAKQQGRNRIIYLSMT